MYIYVCILTINSLQIIMIEGIYIVRGNIMSCTKDLTMEEMYEWCVCLRIYIPGDQLSELLDRIYILGSSKI